MAERSGAIWIPLQPTAECHRMDPRVVAVGQGGRVVVRYVWKGQDGQGWHFRTETMADYHVRESRLARAQMFHFDLAGLTSFLEGAGVTTARSTGRRTSDRPDGGHARRWPRWS